ncbi:MAG: FAD-dependent oxidoreductase [Deltaproteobacteria bacterium]|nr:FAD-dependent oxidoreductase [Deltaproteobacteria bacterium]
MSDATDFDVVVAGAGVAGALAALRARTLGARVLLVARKGGATASWSGAVDVADPFVDATPAPGGGAGGLDALDRGGAVVDAVEALAARHPRHPYARLGAARVAVDDALDFLVRAVPGLDLVRRPDGRNHVLVTAAGTVKRAALAPRSQLLDVADLPPGAIVGVVGWQDLAGFDAGSVEAMLRFVCSLSARAPRVLSVVVPRVFSLRAPWDRAAAFAAFLDEADHRAQALAALREGLRSLTPTPTHLLTPAVLSRKPLAPPALLAIDDAVGRPLRELLSLPPSVPGERLVQALRDACVAAGVIVEDGVVTSPVVVAAVAPGGDAGSEAGRRVTAVHVGGRQVATQAVVLAGGRFLGGGLVRDQVAREPLLGLPVFVDGVELGDRFTGDLLGDVVDAPHALLRAGLLVDDRLRPLDGARRVAFDNVVAAGTIVGGWDPARDGTALGVAAWQGWLAGRAAVECGQ